MEKMQMKASEIRALIMKKEKTELSNTDYYVVKRLYDRIRDKKDEMIYIKFSEKVALTNLSKASDLIISEETEEEKIKRIMGKITATVCHYTEVPQDVLFEKKSREREIVETKMLIFALTLEKVKRNPYKYTKTKFYKTITNYLNLKRCSIYHTLKVIKDVDYMQDKLKELRFIVD